MSTTERQARMGLAALLPMGAPDLTELVAADGAVAVWESLLELGDATPWARRAEGIDIEVMQCATSACGARFLIPGDEQWPACLDDLTTARLRGQGGAPLGLWVRGSWDIDLGRRGIAVVGARASSGYGNHVAHELGADLSSDGFGIVSGLAYGIDAAAHRGALAAGGLTVAVLASGIDRPYPLSHAGLMSQIVRDGAVVSEAPPGTTPRKASFLARNRLIATLSAGVVVVEAAARSGARNTAAWAGELGRVVMAVPGPVTSSMSATPHHLIRDGMAVLVTSASDVASLVGGLDAQEELPLRGEPVPLDKLPPLLRELRECIASGETIDVGVASRRTGATVVEAMVGLEELAEAGWVEEVAPGAWSLPRRPKG